MNILVALLLLSAPANASFSAYKCEAMLLKMQNQIYHIKTGKFVWIRALHHAMKQGIPVKRGWARLSLLKPIHPIDYPIPAMRARLRSRVDVLSMFHDEIIEVGLPIDAQAELLPSSGPIRVIEDAPDLIVKDGNSRLEALKMAFPDTDPMIEVEKYDTHDPFLLFLVHKLRQSGGVEGATP